MIQQLLFKLIYYLIVFCIYRYFGTELIIIYLLAGINTKLVLMMVEK